MIPRRPTSRILQAGALLCLLATAAASTPAVGRSPVRVAEVLCDGRRDPVGVDPGRVRFSWVMESDARGQSQGAYAIEVASSLEALLAGRPDVWASGRVGGAREPARALRRPAARVRAGLLLAREGRGRGGAAHRLERAGAFRHRPRRCRRLGRGPLDRLRGHAGAGEARPGNPRAPRPEAPAEAETAGRAAPAPRVRGAPARHAGPALRERPRPLRGVPQRREGGRPVPRAGLDGLRPHRALRRVRRDRAASRRPERDRGHRRKRLPPHRARALPQAQRSPTAGRSSSPRCASSTRTAAARPSRPAPPGRRRRRRSPSPASTGERTSTRGSSPRAGPPPISTTRAGAARRRPLPRPADCRSRRITRCA